MEYWKNGIFWRIVKYLRHYSITSQPVGWIPSFHHSIISSFHYSIIPIKQAQSSKSKVYPPQRSEGGLKVKWEFNIWSEKLRSPRTNSKAVYLKN
jgi:hypothetical protein